MALDASKVRMAVTGAIFKGPTSSTAPTGTSGAPAGFVDLGYANEGGIEVEMPGEGDSTVVRAWQNNAVVRTIRTPSEDSPTWKVTFLETKKEVIETYFGVTITQTATEGSFEWKAAGAPSSSYIFDYVDGAELTRDYLPNGVVTEVDSHNFMSTDVTGYSVTIAADIDPVKGYNFKRWSTSLKTGA